MSTYFLGNCFTLNISNKELVADDTVICLTFATNCVLHVLQIGL